MAFFLHCQFPELASFSCYGLRSFPFAKTLQAKILDWIFHMKPSFFLITRLMPANFFMTLLLCKFHVSQHIHNNVNFIFLTCDWFFITFFDLRLKNFLHAKFLCYRNSGILEDRVMQFSRLFHHVKTTYIGMWLPNGIFPFQKLLRKQCLPTFF